MVGGVNTILPKWWNGIHVGLKNRWAHARKGSTPFFGISIIFAADLERSEKLGTILKSLRNTKERPTAPYLTDLRKQDTGRYGRIAL